MDATEATRVLAELQAHEPRLERRLGGTTIMVWGLVSAAIFLAYGVTEPLLAGAQQMALAVLWAPFVLAGAVITHQLWKQHALRFGGDNTTGKDTLAITAAFLVLGAGLFAGSRMAGVEWTQAGIMASVNGLVAWAIGFMVRRHGARGWTHLIGAGTAMVLGGVLIGILAWSGGASALAAAAICGTSWSVAGNAIHHQG